MCLNLIYKFPAYQGINREFFRKVHTSEKQYEAEPQLRLTSTIVNREICRDLLEVLLKGVEAFID